MLGLAEWCETATTAQRCEAATRLLERLFDQGCRDAEGEGALLLLCEDPSPKVRALVAARLAIQPDAPRRIVRLLAEDVDSVAVPLASRSDALREDDLVDLCATGSIAVQCSLARRRRLTLRVCAALVEVGARAAVEALLVNDTAAISPGTLHRLMQLHGADGHVRELLLKRAELPAELRDRILDQTTEALAQSSFVQNVLGPTRARRVALEARSDGTAMIADALDGAGVVRFVDHLRKEERITAALLVRLSCEGRIELFAACLSALSGVAAKRVRAILVDARAPAFEALCKGAGVASEIRPLLLATLRAWKGISLGHVDVAERQAPTYVIDKALAQIAATGGAEELRAILSRLSLNATRRTAAHEQLRAAA